MPEPMSPEGLRQPAVPIPSEQLAPREIKQFAIKVDGKETRYPENYPFPFIADGAPAAIRSIMSGISSDREKLGGAINAYLEPSQKVFENANNLPEWYQQTLGPILERNHLSLNDVKPADTHILGDDFRWTLEDIYNFPFPPQLQIAAARHMGQTEGIVPTLSALMQELKKSDSIRFEELMTTLLKRGPDGFAMAAYLVAPEEEKAEKEERPDEEFSFDKVVSTKDGQTVIDTQAMRELINTTWKPLQYPPPEQFASKHNANELYYRLRESAKTPIKLGSFFSPSEIQDITERSHVMLEQIIQFPRGTFAEANYVRLLHSPDEIKGKINQTSQPRVDTTDWYTSRMIPAMQRIIDGGLYKQVSLFKPTSAEQVVTEDELEHGLRMLFHLDIPAGSVRAAGKDFTLGNILKQQANKDPEGFEKNLAMLMVTGYEGYTIAETLAKYVSGIDIPTSYAYGKIEHPEFYRLPQQKDIPPALLTLLNFPLPTIRRAATVGALLKNLSDEQKQQLLIDAQGKGVVNRFIAFEATHVEKAA